MFLYYKQILELYNGTMVAYDMFRGMTSNKDSLSYLFTGWFKYLFNIKHEYGYGSGSTASQIAMDNINNLYDKTIIVTGGNSGIGLSICNALCAVSHTQNNNKLSQNVIKDNIKKTPCSIIMASRNEEKSQNAIKALLGKYPKADIRFIKLDLGKLRSIISFVNALKKLPNKIQENLSILINNAGVAMILKGQSVKFNDNLDKRFEKTFAVNYLGPFILTQLIYDNWFKLNKNKQCRIINQSSLIHTVVSQLNENELINMDKIIKYHLNKRYNHVISYSYSKLFNILHTKMMMDEYYKNNVLFNSCHPGTSIHTGLTSKHMSSNIINISNYLFGWILWKSNDQCAATSMLLACDKRIGNDCITGKYFDDCGQREPSRYAKNKKIMNNLKKYSVSVYNNINYY